MPSCRRRNPVMKDLADKAVTLVLLTTLVVQSQIFSVDCGTLTSSLITRGTYNTSDGKVCYFCSPGQYWVGDCIHSREVARCKPCEKGFFQTVENIAHSCQPCTTYCIQLYQDFINVCNATTDNICQCRSGYFRFDEEGRCKQHTTCPPGQGVKYQGDKDRDTVCEGCKDGKTFSGSDSATENCMPCTSCENLRLFEMTRCTNRSDSECRNFTVTPRSTDKQDSLGTIIGGIVGGIVAVATIIIIAAVCYFKRCHKKLECCLNDSEGVPFTEENSRDTVHSGIYAPEKVPFEKNQHQNRYNDYERKNVMKESGGLRNSQNSNVTDDSGCVSVDSNPSPGQGNFLDEDRARVHTSRTGIPKPVLQKLSKDLISHDWKFFFRELLVQESEIDQVEIDYPNRVREQIYQLLHYLNQRGNLNITDIIGSLKSLGRNDLAEKYSKVEFS